MEWQLTEILTLADEWTKLLNTLEIGAAQFINANRDAIEKRLIDAHYINIIIQHNATDALSAEFNKTHNIPVEEPDAFNTSYTRIQYEPHSSRIINSLKRVKSLNENNPLINQILIEYMTTKGKIDDAKELIHQFESLQAKPKKGYSWHSDIHLKTNNYFEYLKNHVEYLSAISKNKKFNVPQPLETLVILFHQRQITNVSRLPETIENALSEKKFSFEPYSDIISYTPSLLKRIGVSIDPEDATYIQRPNSIDDNTITMRESEFFDLNEKQRISFFYRKREDIISRTQIGLNVVTLPSQIGPSELPKIFTEIIDFTPLDTYAQYEQVAGVMDRIGHLPTIINYLNKIAESIPNYSAISMLLMHALEYSGDSVKDQKVGREFFKLLEKDTSLIISSKNGLFADIPGRKKNHVCMIRPEYQSKMHTGYILKMNPFHQDPLEERKMLRKEYAGILLAEVLMEDFKTTNTVDTMNLVTSRIPYPVAYIECDERTILVEKCINRISLEEFEKNASRGELVEEIKLTLETLAQLHIAATEKVANENWYLTVADSANNRFSERLPFFDYVANLVARAVGNKKEHRIGANSELASFIKEYSAFINAEGLKFVIHGDSYPHNCRVGGALIDFGELAIGAPTQDVAEILEYSEWSDIPKTELFDYYIKQITARKSDPKLEDTLRKNYHRSAIHNAVCQIGSELNVGNVEYAQNYIIAALELMNPHPKVKDSFVSYLRASRKKPILEVLV